MPLYIHFSFTRRIFHLLLVTKVRLFEKSSVRRENLGTRLLSGSSIGWFHYLFVWNKIYFFLTHKPWYFMKKSIAFDRFFDRVLEKRETSALKARARDSRANWDWALKAIKWRRSMQNMCVVKLDRKVTFLDSRYSYITSIGSLTYSDVAWQKVSHWSCEVCSSLI